MVKVDLHIHVDGYISKNNIINFLDSAQNQNLKAISFVEHSQLNSYFKNTNIPPFYEDDELLKLIKSREAKKHFSGKIISGIELDVNFNENNSEYNGKIIHILYYGFDPIKLKNEKWFNLQKNFSLLFNDLNTLFGKCHLLDLPTPNIQDIFNELSQTKKHIFQIFHSWINSNPTIADLYSKKLNLTKDIISKKSQFIRNTIQNLDSPLFFTPEMNPNINDLNEIKSRCGGKFVVAHPFYMFNSKDFNVINYLDSIRKNVNIDGIECSYRQNTPEEITTLNNYCEKNNLYKSGGSDTQLYCENIVDHYSKKNKHYFFDSIVGVSLENYVNGSPAIYLTADENFINSLEDLQQ